MFNQAIADAICAQVADGKSLRKACASIKGAKTPTFLLWCKERPELADQYARARETGSDAEFERLAEIQEEAPQIGPSGTVDAGWVAWKRLQVDTLKWQLSKQQPRKYGDKLDLNHSGSVRFEKIECVVVDPQG